MEDGWDGDCTGSKNVQKEGNNPKKDPMQNMIADDVASPEKAKRERGMLRGCLKQRGETGAEKGDGQAH